MDDAYIDRLVENIEHHLLAWENEEHSVQVEHMPLIRRTRRLLGEYYGEPTNPREKDDDDGQTYSDPRDEMEERLWRD